MPPFASAAEPQKTDIGTGQCLADIDAAISAAEKEFAVGSVLPDAKEVLPAL